MGSSYSICNSHLVFGPEHEEGNTKTVVTNDGRVRVYQKSRKNSVNEKNLNISRNAITYEIKKKTRRKTC
tara:strand:- start:295 stop:504 length:210 start_codon:yes stop_codon:yes gene_type:complete